MKDHLHRRWKKRGRGWTRTIDPLITSISRSCYYSYPPGAVPHSHEHETDNILSNNLNQSIKKQPCRP